MKKMIEHTIFPKYFTGINVSQEEVPPTFRKFCTLSNFNPKKADFLTLN